MRSGKASEGSTKIVPQNIVDPHGSDFSTIPSKKRVKKWFPDDQGALFEYLVTSNHG